MPLIREAIELADSAAEAWTTAWCRLWLGWALLRAASLTEASQTLRDVLPEGDRFGAKPLLAGAWQGLSAVSLRLGDSAGARGPLSAAARLFAEMGTMREQAETLELWAELAASEADWVTATRCAGAAASIRSDIGAPKHEIDRPPFDAAVRSAVDHIGEAQAAAAYAGGHSKGFKVVLDMADPLARPGDQGEEQR